MENWTVLLSAIGIIFALLSGLWWIKASAAKVLGKGKAGVGYGGTPVNVENEKGEVLDFLATFKLRQSTTRALR
jgi:hypothetical protein